MIPRPTGDPAGLVVWLCSHHAGAYRGAGDETWLARHGCLPPG